MKSLAIIGAVILTTLVMIFAATCTGKAPSTSATQTED